MKYDDLPLFLIHVNRQHIAKNAKDDGVRPTYIVRERVPGRKTYSVLRYARQVWINGPSRAVYNGTQLKCGARAWIETNGPLVLVDEMTYAEASGVD